MALIRVVVPVYKVEKYIHCCVDSILAQTLSDFELILVDDGSPDNCPAICDEYARQDHRVRVIHQKNQGIAAARNAGIYYSSSNCDSEWITFVDSDDLIHPQMLELLYDAAIEKSADISLCGAVEAHMPPADFYCEKRPNVSRLVVNEACILELYQNGAHRYWTAWAKLIRMDYVRSMPFETGRIYEDNNLVFKWLNTAAVLANLNESLYFYTINDSGISKSAFTPKQLDYVHALKTQVLYYSKRKLPRLLRLLCERYVRDSTQMYLKAREGPSSKHVAQKLKWNILWFWVKNCTKIHFSKEETRFLLNVLCPVIMRVYWFGQGIKRILRKEGVGGLISKAVLKLQKAGKK